ncbi:MAG: hypothetical protein ABIJ97_15460 [Bacteroidota bacterium]
MIAKKLFFLLFAFPTWVFGQCFTSPGNPIGGTANMGTLSKGILRGNIFHKYNYADRYLNGDSPSDFIYYKKAFYNYTGSVFAYGITDKLNIETEAGFFENKTVIFSEKFGNQTLANTIHTGYGFSNAVLSLKYNVFTNNKKGLNGQWPWEGRYHLGLIQLLKMELPGQRIYNLQLVLLESFFSLIL